MVEVLVSTWNGMTEPLGVGDRVRVVAVHFGGLHVDIAGEVTVVTEVTPAGHVGTWPGGYTGASEEEAYITSRLKNVVFARQDLYKLPPDWDNVTDETRQTKKAEPPQSVDADAGRGVELCPEEGVLT